MRYRMALPPDCDSRVLLPQAAPAGGGGPPAALSLARGRRSFTSPLMGRVQAEILRSLVAQRFGVEVELDRGPGPIQGDHRSPGGGRGPLRAPAPLCGGPPAAGAAAPGQRPGAGHSAVREDDLDRSWQRLILTHLAGKAHLGVLTGSPVTDMKITLMSGRAHIKHTEGGDFRQATYRAVRQGLMQARSRLLEPYYAFRLEVPAGAAGPGHQ